MCPKISDSGLVVTLPQLMNPESGQARIALLVKWAMVR